MSTQSSAGLKEKNDWLSGLQAFPSLEPEDWRDVEASTARVLEMLGEEHAAETSIEPAYRYGSLLYDRGDDCGALEVWEALIPHAQAFGRNGVAAYCAARLAKGHVHFDETREALVWYRRGRRWSKALPASHPIHGRLAGTQGAIYQHRREWSQARKAYRRALKNSAVDPALAHKWEGMGVEDLEAVRMAMLVDCYLREARVEGHSRESLRKAGQILQAAQEMASSFYTRCHCQLNMLELLWIKDDLGAAETLAMGLSALLNNPAFPEETRLRFRPPLAWFMSLIAISRDNIPQAQQHMREAFRWMRARRNPPTEELIVREMIDLYAETHRRYYGGFREDTVLATLEDEGAWILSLVEYCESRSRYLLGGHARKVEKACRILTEHMDRSTGESMPPLLEATYLRGAALLHDIGLLDVSWATLNRIRPHRPSDLRRFQSHALAGGRILEELGFPMTARMAEEHHEFADGSGYPIGTSHQTDMGGILALAEAVVSSCSPSYVVPTPRHLSEAVRDYLGPRARQFQPRALKALKRAADSGALAPLEVALS